MSWAEEIKYIIWQLFDPIGFQRNKVEQTFSLRKFKHLTLPHIWAWPSAPVHNSWFDIRVFHLPTIKLRIRFDCFLAYDGNGGTSSNLNSTPLPSLASPQNHCCLHQNNFICTYESIVVSELKTWSTLNHRRLFPSEYHRSCLLLWYKVSDYISLSKLCWNEGHSICHNQ